MIYISNLTVILVAILCFSQVIVRKVTAEENLQLKSKKRTLPGFEKDKAGSWDGPFYFIQGADTQYGIIENYKSKVTAVLTPLTLFSKKKDPGSDIEIKNTKAAIAAINAMTPRPRFFVVCGDLVDAMPDTSFRIAQENAFIRTFKDLHPDIPLVCVCGNHDVGDQPTEKSIQKYTNKFGDDYFTFYSGGVMFIVINSQFLKDSSMVKDLAYDHDKWLEEQLTEAKSGKYKHVIIFQHIPWFVRKPDERNGYFNIDKEIRQTMLQKFHDANVRAIFCGHYHGNGGGFYKDLEVVVTSAVGSQLRWDKPGFRVVKLLENSIQHQYYATENAPKNITLD